MSIGYFDDLHRFVIEDYAARPPFASFLPGIAGPFGIPMWVFYVNRGQAIAGFGVESKDHPIMEFQPANKAYQQVPLTGFRTFIKLQRSRGNVFYEPFSPLTLPGSRQPQMHIGANELELIETNLEAGLQVHVLYLTLPGEHFAALVRQVTLHNLTSQPIEGEMLDGMPLIIPYGVDNTTLKDMGRTAEAWMDVFNRERGIPFYRVRSSIQDKPEVEAILSGHFYLAFGPDGKLLPAICDPRVVFAQNTALTWPDAFLRSSLVELLECKQQTAGKTPCGFSGVSFALAPAESFTLSTLIGHAPHVDIINGECDRLTRAGYISDKRREGNELVEALTETVWTRTELPLFDAYCRQSLLDNVMRGGWPILLGDRNRKNVYHIYSRKHGDLERDYNAFYLAAEFLSQGNGNYRDVAQNRRNDVLLNPQVEDHDILTFMNLVQADGYNPLVVQGTRFQIPLEKHTALQDLAENPEALAPILNQAWTPGQLLQSITDRQIRLKVSPKEFLSRAVGLAEAHIEATFGEGYWVDHWTYDLDLIESYLAVYPDRKEELLFGKRAYTFYDSPAVVKPRAEKYVLAGTRVRQLGAVCVDPEKAALIASRVDSPHTAREAHGQGAIYRTTLLAKLLCLVTVKFATLDPEGMGIEMEAGRPGWYDALNGLPSLLGSSMCETYELARWIEFILQAIQENPAGAVALPLEVYELLARVAAHLELYNASDDSTREFAYWEAVSDERERYRSLVRLGFDGHEQTVPLADAQSFLILMRTKIWQRIQRALEMNHGIPPTYLTFQADTYEILKDERGKPRGDGKKRPFVRPKSFSAHVLPLFLEGPARFLKLQSDRETARRLYRQVKSSELFDRKLKMYKVNSSLENQPDEIGRARAFTPGWLENESIWMHMEYKYLLEILKAGLYEEFFEDFQNALPPFLDPEVYGRSPLENSSFIVSNAHPDESLHGHGFVARLSGATAEFLSIWHLMMVGAQPFYLRDGVLCLALKPILPSWLFDAEGEVGFKFLGSCAVIYHNPTRRDTFGEGAVKPCRIALVSNAGQTTKIPGGVIAGPNASQVRAGQVKTIHVFME